MNVLMLSTDQNIFKDGSASQERMKDYGGLVEELHIIVASQISPLRQGSGGQANIKSQKFGNVFIYPTDNKTKPLYFFNAYKIAKKILVASGQWLITVQDPFETGLVGYLVKKKFKLPLQIQVHTDFLSPYFWKESLKNKIRVILGKWLVKQADGIRVVSERIKNSLISKLRVPNYKITVLPIFVDTEKIKNAPVKTDLHQKYPGRFIVLMASRLTREKNIGLAIQAIKNLVSKHTNILLLIVGSGPESEKLKAKSYKLKANVIFEPWIDDLASYYKTADIFVLTSNYEGGARAPAEAVAAGLPVVMTDVPPARETVIDGKNGFIVPVNDHRQLADKLIELVSSKDKRIMFKKQSLATAVGFITKEVYLKLYYQALESVLP